MIGKVIETEKILLSGYPGILVKGEITQAIKEEPYPPILIKSYLVGNKIYQLMVTGSEENKNDSSINYFFDSFELKK